MMNGWLDTQGYETADKCAWQFSAVNNGLVTLANGARFKLQGEWSNNAYYTRSGFNDGTGYYGCTVSA